MICFECGDEFPGTTRHKYCPACKDLHKQEQRAIDEEKRKRTRKEAQQEKPTRYQGYYIEFDSLVGGEMEKGMFIPLEEHRNMKKDKTYYPGTIVTKGNARFRMEIVKGKMIEVEI